MAEYEFEVVEQMTTSHSYIVIAGTRAEALEKVLDRAPDVITFRNDLYPVRPMTVRDVKRLERVTRG